MLHLLASSVHLNGALPDVRPWHLLLPSAAPAQINTAQPPTHSHALLLPLLLLQIAALKTSNVVVMYASAYGNTAALAQAISRGLVKGGVAVNTVNLEVTSLDDVVAAVKNSDGFTIGSPTLGGHMPTPVQVRLTCMHACVRACVCGSQVLVGSSRHVAPAVISCARQEASPKDACTGMWVDNGRVTTHV